LVCCAYLRIDQDLVVAVAPEVLAEVGALGEHRLVLVEGTAEAEALVKRVGVQHRQAVPAAEDGDRLAVRRHAPHALGLGPAGRRLVDVGGNVEEEPPLRVPRHPLVVEPAAVDRVHPAGHVRAVSQQPVCVWVCEARGVGTCWSRGRVARARSGHACRTRVSLLMSLGHGRGSAPEDLVRAEEHVVDEHDVVEAFLGAVEGLHGQVAQVGKVVDAILPPRAEGRSGHDGVSDAVVGRA
jgi:hypothetical protein